MNKTTIKLYSTHSCPFCIMEKQWLDQNKVPHQVVYVDQNREEALKMVQSTGQMGVPVTELVSENGEKEFIIGFDRKTLADRIGIK